MPVQKKSLNSATAAKPTTKSLKAAPVSTNAVTAKRVVSAKKSVTAMKAVSARRAVSAMKAVSAKVAR